MSEAGQCDVAAALVDQAIDVQALIEALRLEGAEQFDPVRWHYIDVLAQRAGAHQGSVKRILDEKLRRAVSALSARISQTRRDADNTITPAETDGRRETLGDLVRHLAQHTPERVDSRLDAHLAPRAELKSVRYFRNTWSKLSAEKQVTLALGQAPKNAGPINSHWVALRSLALMRDTSPDYLNRFMSHVNTLLCLDLGELGTRPPAKPAKPAATGDGGKKAKTSRARSR